MLTTYTGGQCHKNYQLMEFKWLTNLTIDNTIKLLEKKDTKIGYIYEVDVEYPKELWKSHNDYPLAPEKITVDNVEKLFFSFYKKRNYEIHYKNLKKYLEEGLILKKVHRGIMFYQFKWMEPYIVKNTELRKKSIK